MQFKDAAYDILKRKGKPLHYNHITDLAISAGILDTSGQTPHTSMGALLYYSEPHCQDHKLTKLRWINESGD